MKTNAFTIIELVFVIASVSVLLGMTITVTTKFYERRSIDGITYKISSTLNTARLLASRSGVEFETHLDYTEDNKTLTITTFRGTSNRNTLENDFIAINSLDIPIAEDYTVVPSSDEFQFNPNGTLGVSQTIFIRPVDDTSNISKCGEVTLFRLGRIKTATGNWDGEDCNVIGDIQDNEPGS